jgi:hypothetical protein
MCLARASWLSALAVESVAEVPPKSNAERDNLCHQPRPRTGTQDPPVRALDAELPDEVLDALAWDVTWGTLTHEAIAVLPT